MASPYLLKGFYKKGPGGNSQLVRFGSDAIVLESGATLTSHINDMSAHLPFSDIENAIIQRIHAAIGRVLDGGDGSSLLNKHATMRLLSEDISLVSNKVNGFLTDLADGGVIDKLSELVSKLDLHDTGISNIQTSISVLPSLVSQLNTAIVDISNTNNNLNALSDTVDTLIPLLDQYTTVVNTLTTIQAAITSINGSIAVIPSLSDTTAAHTAAISTINDTLTTAVTNIDTLLPLIANYNTLLATVTSQGMGIDSLQTAMAGIGTNVTSLNSEVTALSDDLNDTKVVVTSQGTKLATLESDLATTVLSVSNNATDIDTIESTLVSHTSSIADLENELSTVTNTVNTHTLELTDINADITNLQTTTDTLNSSLVITNQHISALETSQATQDLILSNINDALVTVGSEIDTLEDISNSNATTIVGLTSALQATQTVVATQGSDIVALNTEVDSISNTVEELVSNISPRVIGVCHYAGANALNNFRHINQEGNFLSGFKYYTSAIYTDKMRDVVIGGDHMKEIDTLYIKTSISGPVGTDSEGKKCWWISPDPLPGFRPMLAFKRDGVIKPHVYIGKYMGYYSTPETQPTTGYSRSTYENNLATYKNVDGVTGFRMVDIYDLGLLRTLLLVFGGSADVKTVWGDNFSNVVKPDTGSTGAKALGIFDLWRSYHYCIDKLKVSRDRKIELVNPFTGATIYTDLDMPYSTANRYLSEIVLGDLQIGEDIHNYMELFLPAAFVTDIRDAAFMDGVRFTSSSANSEKDVYIGGSPRDSSTDYISPGGVTDKTRLFCGIFMCVMEHNVNHTSSYGSMRLAKS